VLAVFRRRDYALLWVAGVVSVLGDFVLLIALPFRVYELTGSALATGTTYLAGALPRVLLGSVAGVFVDRWDHRRTMIAADLLRAAVLLGLLAVHSSEALWLVYVVGFAESALSQFFAPARSALLPRIVPPEERLAANSLGAFGDGAVRLIGPLLGGALAGAVGLWGVVLFDSASFLLSAGLLALLRGGARPLAPAGTPDGLLTGAAAARWAAVWRELREGLRVVGRKPVVRGTFAVIGLATFAFGMTDPLIPVIMKEVLGGTALDFGALASVQGAGVLVGGLLVARLRRAVPPAGLIALGLGLGSLLLLVMIHAASLPLALALIGPWGACLVVYEVSAATLLQDRVPDGFRGRVFGALATVQGALAVAAIALASLLGAVADVAWVVTGACVLLLFGAGVAAAMPRVSARWDEPSDLAGPSPGAGRAAEKSA
jgi:MFS family permease